MLRLTLLLLLLVVPLQSLLSPRTVQRPHVHRHQCGERIDDPLIPRELLFENPDYRDPVLSPDGNYLAYLAPAADESFPYIYVRNLTDPSLSDRMVTDGTSRGLSFFRWGEDSQTIFFLLDKMGRENYHLWAIDAITPGAMAKDLTPGDDIKASHLMTNKHHVDEVLVGTNQRDPSVFDMYRCYYKTGELVLDTKNPGNVVGWGADEASFQIRRKLVRNQLDSSTTLMVLNDRGEWGEVYVWPYGEEGTFVDFAPNNTCWLTSSVGRDTTALLLMNLTNTKVLKEISANAKCDCGKVVLDPETKEVRGISYNYARTEWVFFDPALEQDYERLASRDTEVRVCSKTRDEKLWLVAFISSDHPLEFVLYNQTSKTTSPLFCARAGLLEYELAPMEDVRITTRDGEELVAYLTRANVRNDPTPLILMVHGGPWARDFWGFNQFAQWFANRGYATLQVNFRGSTGYGKTFRNMGDRGWGVGVMQHDLTDSVQWAISQGIADPNRICIYGGSYGGYACLAGLTFTPDLYACGVDIVGPSNVKTLLDSIPAYWGPLRNQTLLRIGDVDNDEAFNRKISPLFHIDNIKVPLLIAHGAKDIRVKQAEADQIAFAMHEKGIPVQYIVYPNEGHGMRRPQNRVDFSGRVELFLQKHLGGRATPFVRQPGSTAQFPLLDGQREELRRSLR